jgi:hypothetical protein
MVAGVFTKNCFYRILRYLSSFAFFSMPSCSTDGFASPYIYYTKGLHTTVAKPTYAPGSSSPIEDRFIAEALKIPAIGHLQTPTLERVLL